MRQLFDFALYLVFFPQLIAPSKMRARLFFTRLSRAVNDRVPIDLRSFLLLFLIGFFKKSCIADQLEPVVFRNLKSFASFGFGGSALASALFIIQFFCAFSGYCDMSRAAAGLMGLAKRKTSFGSRFSARSILFWNDWTASLSNWFYDYVYWPLKGDRKGTPRALISAFVTMALAVFWYGTKLPMLLWGVIHGLSFGVSRLLKYQNSEPQIKARSPMLIYGVALGFFGCFLLTLRFYFPRKFRFDEILEGFGNFNPLELGRMLPFYPSAVTVMVLLASYFFYHGWGLEKRLLRTGSDWLFFFCLGLVFSLFWAMSPY